MAEFIFTFSYRLCAVATHSLLSAVYLGVRLRFLCIQKLKYFYYSGHLQLFLNYFFVTVCFNCSLRVCELAQLPS